MNLQEKVSAIELPAPEVPGREALGPDVPPDGRPTPAVLAPAFPAPGQELYLPFGSTDPDFYIPADCERGARGLSRWLRALPLFGR
jgi:hypothetical protein